VKKEKAIRISTTFLFALGTLDLIRGFMHTFNINWAATTFAKIALIPDSLMLMGAFGISNILTGLIYLLICKKAKHLVPYVLALIPTAYLLGMIGLRMQGVQAESAFNGKYMMLGYLGLCALISAYYFISARKEA